MKQEAQILKKENERLKKRVEQLKDLVLLDFLTKVYNRNAFSQFIQKTCKEVSWTKNQKSRRKQLSQFSLLLIDIDDFKKFNDKYGHLEGDRVLKNTAKLLENCTREFDVVARWGGEEFAIILRGTNKEQAENKAKFILQQAREKLPITFSIGLIQSDPGCESSETMFKKVDKALYKAKEKGKDQVIIAK